MILTLSERRLSELIRQLEGINDSDEEILFRMQHYAAKLFNQVSEYGIRMVEMVEHHGGIGSFRFDIKGVGMDWQTGGFNWEQLNQGLSFLNPLAVSFEREDLWAICDGLVGTAMNSVWYEIQPNLQRLSVNEVRQTFESWCQHVAFGNAPDFLRDPVLEEIQAQSAFEQAGIEDPLKHHLEREEFNRQEIEAYKEATGNQIERSWGVIHPDGERY